LFETPYKTLNESKRKEKSSKKKGRAQRQLKRLRVAQKKNQDVKKQTKEKTEPSHAFCFNFISRLCGIWKDIRG
jgi:hypothetical protein